MVISSHMSRVWLLLVSLGLPFLTWLVESIRDDTAPITRPQESFDGQKTRPCDVELKLDGQPPNKFVLKNDDAHRYNLLIVLTKDSDFQFNFQAHADVLLRTVWPDDESVHWVRVGLGSLQPDRSYKIIMKDIGWNVHAFIDSKNRELVRVETVPNDRDLVSISEIAEGFFSSYPQYSRYRTRAGGANCRTWAKHLTSTLSGEEIVHLAPVSSLSILLCASTRLPPLPREKRPDEYLDDTSTPSAAAARGNSGRLSDLDGFSELDPDESDVFVEQEADGKSETYDIDVPTEEEAEELNRLMRAECYGNELNRVVHLPLEPLGDNERNALQPLA